MQIDVNIMPRILPLNTVRIKIKRSMYIPEQSSLFGFFSNGSRRFLFLGFVSKGQELDLLKNFDSDDENRASVFIS